MAGRSRVGRGGRSRGGRSRGSRGRREGPALGLMWTQGGRHKSGRKMWNIEVFVIVVSQTSQLFVTFAEYKKINIKN